jgi:hypothetical protein
MELRTQSGNPQPPGFIIKTLRFSRRKGPVIHRWTGLRNRQRGLQNSMEAGEQR